MIFIGHRNRDRVCLDLIKSFWFGGYLQSLKQILRYCTESPVIALSCNHFSLSPNKTINRWISSIKNVTNGNIAPLNPRRVSLITHLLLLRGEEFPLFLYLGYHCCIHFPCCNPTWNCIDCTVYHSCVATLKRIWCGLLQTEPPMDHLLLHLAQVLHT